MSDFIAAAKSYTAERRTLQKIDVPELDQAIYFYPEMTLVEYKEIFPYFTGDQIDLEGFVVTLVVRARDEDGKRLFSNAHKPELRRLSSDLLSKIINQMKFGTFEVDDPEGNF